MFTWCECKYSLGVSANVHLVWVQMFTWCERKCSLGVSANVHLVWVQMLATPWVCALTRPLLRTSQALLVGDRYSIHPTNQPKDDPRLTVRATDNTLGLQRQRMAAVNSERGQKDIHILFCACYGAKCIFIVLNCLYHVEDQRRNEMRWNAEKHFVTRNTAEV